MSQASDAGIEWSVSGGGGVQFPSNSPYVQQMCIDISCSAIEDGNVVMLPRNVVPRSPDVQFEGIRMKPKSVTEIQPS